MVRVERAGLVAVDREEEKKKRKDSPDRRRPSSGGQGPRQEELARSPHFFFASQRIGTAVERSAMSPCTPSALFARLRSLLPAFVLVSACSSRTALDWPRILAEVRAAYPTVPQVTVEELLAQETDPAPLLLDARSNEEYAVSHLGGALSTPDEAAALIALSGVGPEREILAYCSVGLRSSALAERLRARGFKRTANLEGGIFAWANAGQPTYRGTERMDQVHPFDERWSTLLAPERRAH